MHHFHLNNAVVYHTLHHIHPTHPAVHTIPSLNPQGPSLTNHCLLFSQPTPAFADPVPPCTETPLFTKPGPEPPPQLAQPTALFAHPLPPWAAVPYYHFHFSMFFVFHKITHKCFFNAFFFFLFLFCAYSLKVSFFLFSTY